MAVAMLLTEWAEGRHQHQQGPAGPVVPAVGPALAQMAGGAGQAQPQPWSAKQPRQEE